jgi:predicted cupin superfamily sugar epimerase
VPLRGRRARGGLMDVADAVAAWELAPHPEGGHYRETYRSAVRVTPPGWSSPRALATSILYLLAAGERSAWHRVAGDELWLWQGGAAMELAVGDATRVVGPDPGSGHELQVLVDFELRGA